MNIRALQKSKTKIVGFSMVEMIACVAILGIISFLAIPSLTKMRGESEIHLAVARAEALNMSMASYMQALGRSQASTNWGTAAPSTLENNRRYGLVRSYLAFSETTLDAFLPQGYKVDFPRFIADMTKVALRDPAGNPIRY